MREQIVLPKEVLAIINTLESAGFEAYAVGGCVRDSLCGIVPNDWDLTTSAKPQDVKKLFSHTIDTGIAHGTVTIRKNQKSFEVTTFRIDGAYSDARHPDGVTFTKLLAEDLRRRDFTVNAMAYHPTKGLVDLFEGRQDLKKRQIRCVGNPKERFCEDALRMLRAVRFAAQLGFSIEQPTQDAIKELHETLSMVSAERITTEIIKLICSDHPELMQSLYDLNLSDSFFPEWNHMMETPQNTKHHRASVGEHTIFVMQGVTPTKTLRLAALLHDVAKPFCRKTDDCGNDHFVGHPQIGAKMAEQILRRWKLDNETIHTVCELVRFHDERPELTKRIVRRCISRVGQELCPSLFLLRRADIMGQSEFLREEKLALIDGFELLYKEIMASKDCLCVKDLEINGQDLLELGLESGPMIGQLLQQALAYCLEDPAHNQRELLLSKVKEWI